LSLFFRTCRRCWFLSVIGWAAALPAFAADHAWDAPHFSMEPKALYAAASESVPPAGSDVTLLDNEESYVFDADGRSVHTVYVVYKVLTQRGIDGWDHIGAPWEPWHEQPPEIRARVITPDYASHELDPKTITAGPASAGGYRLYDDRQVARAPLPAVAPGSVIEEEWAVKETAPRFAAGSAAGIYLGHISAPVQHTRLVLEAPSTLPLRYSLFLLPNLQPQRSEANGHTRIVFEYGAMAPLGPAEANPPSDAVPYPMLVFSTGSSWQQVAGAYAAAVDNTIHEAELKPLVDRLLHGQRTRSEKIQAIVGYLGREVRYTGIEFGAAAIIPHPPSETLAHKYGDCKDKATLLVAMLRTAKIPAYVALLRAGARQDVPPGLPGMGLFDHAIVYVPGPPALWIDATDEYARPGELPAPDQGRLALVVRAGSDALVRTPEMSSRDNVLLETREIYLSENGPARVVETSHPRGSLESEYRNYYADKQNQRMVENLTDYMKSAYLADKLDRLDRSDPHDLSQPFELVLESKKAKRGITDLDVAAAAIRLEGLFSRLPDELQRREDEEDNAGGSKVKKQRHADYQLPEALAVEWDYRIVPPLGFQPKPLPQDVTLALGPAALTEQFSAGDDGVVHAVIRFDTVKRRYSAAEATELRNQVAALRGGEAILINFEPVGQALLQQGKVKESFQSYRALIARQPQAAVYHLRIAKALLEAGMGEAAREEARLAVKLEPGSALAEKVLGEVLEFDLVGRKFRPGSDYPGAAAAFRAAAQLDPDDQEITGNLAILLEYNQEGVRYGSGAKLQEAISEYRKLSPEKLAGLELQDNLAYALFYAGDFAEARKYAETLNPQPKALIVACAGAANGSQAGIAEANQRSGGDEEFKQTVKTAGEMLMNLRRYSVAADFLDAGASGESTIHTVGLASMLHKARPHEELKFENNPAGVVTEFFLLSLDPNATLEKFDALLSRNAQAVLKNTDQEALDKFLQSGKEARRTLARNGSFPDVTIDLMLQDMELKTEGSDASGYRVKLQIPSAESGTFFIVNENGKYRILDTAENPNAIGLEILDRVAAHDLEGARVLLNWVRDEQHLEGGDDPLSGEPFPRFWTKGMEADAAQMNLAAAALLAQTKPTAKQGVALLEAAKKAAHDEPERTNLSLALLKGYDLLDNHEASLAVAAELASRYPESKRVFYAYSYALRALGRFEQAQALAQQRRQRMPDDADALRALVFNALAQEDYRAAYEWSRKVVELGKPGAEDLNDLAWWTLFLPETEKPDIETAIKATQLSPHDYHILHTLGCLYAEAGKTKEAREVLIQAMDVQNLDEPNPDYWYAFGRIAEQYGEREAARSDYAKVVKPKEALRVPGSSYRLAQNRLKVMP